MPKKYSSKEIIGMLKIAQDTREQTPINFSDFGVDVVRQKLDIGDYGVLVPNLLDSVFFERKGTAREMLTCIGKDRERFSREMSKARSFPHKYLVFEFDYSQLLREIQKSPINEASVMGSLASWRKQGFQTVFVGNRRLAAHFVIYEMVSIVRDYLKKK